MKSLVALLLTLIACAPFVIAQNPPPKPASSIGGTVAPGWQTFTSEAGNFSALLPGRPQQSAQPTDSPLGKITLHDFTANAGDASYTVMFADYPILFDTQSSIESSLNGSRDSVLHRTKGRLLEEKEIFFGAYPGREWKIKLGGGAIWSRNYLIQQRIYMLVAFLPGDAYAQPSVAAEVARFLESFKLLQAPEAPANLPATSNVRKAINRMELPNDFFTRPLAWRERVVAAHGFKVVFPSEPIEQSIALSPTDPRLNINLWMARGDGFICEVGVQPLLDAPKDQSLRDILFNGLFNSLSNDSGLKVFNQTPAEFQGHPGRAYQVRSQFGEGAGKSFLVGKTLYLLLVFPYRANVPPTQSDKFFSSFQLLNAPAPPPAVAAAVWQEFASPEDRFSVLLPGAPEKKSAQPDSEFGKLQVTQFIASAGTLTFLIQRCEFPAQAEDLSEAADALFDGLMAPIFRDAATAPSQQSIDLNGFPGREAKGKNRYGQPLIARAYLVGSQIYNLVVFTAAEQVDTPEVKKFFDSFKLLSGTPPPAPKSSAPSEPPVIRKPFGPPLAIREDLVPAGAIKVSGGVLQGSAVKRVQPPYPPIAKAANAQDAVYVQIVVSEDGKVIDAVVLSGHPLLRDAALAAARQWEFKPTELSGKPVKVAGMLTFNFTLQ